ncbi:MAG: hypothetical protein PHW41_02660, partial [Eubacteriales bacterium]|nr:hypothetical protein [Eubacteriales bacterium]
MLSIIVFLLAFRFLVQQQYDHLVDSLQLMSNTIKEEFLEDERTKEKLENEDSQKGDSVKDDSEIEDSEVEQSRTKTDYLRDLTTDSNLSVYLYDREGALISHTNHFPLPDRLLQKGKKVPELVFYDQTILLRASSTISDHGTKLGSLVLVYRMASETGFLKLLGFLLLGANLLGV